MGIVVVSNNIRCISVCNTDNSSSRYELELARNLAKNQRDRVYVISTAYKGKELSDEEITLEAANKQSRILSWMNMFQLLSKEQYAKDTTIIAFGYDLIMVIAMLLVKLTKKYKIVLYIFDTHNASLAQTSFLRKILAKLYYKASLLLINFFDGFVFFREGAANRLCIKKPYLLSRPGMNIDNKELSIKKRREKFRISYAGTLMPYNGIEELLNALDLVKYKDIELEIYGSGPLDNIVALKVVSDTRIHFHGRVENSVLREILRTSDLLVNFRKDLYGINSYAFPSKLLEYIELKVPVIMNDMSIDKELLRYTYSFEKLTEQEIAKAIMIAINDTEERRLELALQAYQYAVQKYNWEKIAISTLNFLKTI